MTFVDNHDTIRDDGSAVLHDKLMAYSFILTHEGYPSVFWMDWYNSGLAQVGTPNGIAALVGAHEHFAGGATQVLFAGDDVYIMQRVGDSTHPGLVYVLNNRGDSWNGATVQTQWHKCSFRACGLGRARHQPSRYRVDFRRWTRKLLGWPSRMGSLRSAVVVSGQLPVSSLIAPTLVFTLTAAFAGDWRPVTVH